MVMRAFEDKPATREHVPLLIGIMGPSGGGKTFSALRLAHGIQRVSGGEIFVVDTEARRSLHYAGTKPAPNAPAFKFRHVQFDPPFGPLDYLAAIEHCVRKGASTIIVDSMSHEHEGPGGILEMHQREVERLSKGDERKAERVKMLAWGKPKQERRRLINSLLQMHCNFIFCFRAKEKIKIEPGKEPQPRGFMPIAGEEFVYEMTANALLLPNAGGVPTWQSDETGERMMIKLPQQFRQMLNHGRPLDETMGEEMAKWAAGSASAPEFVRLRELIVTATTVDQLDELKPELAAVRKNKTLPPAEFNALVEMVADRRSAIERGEQPVDDREDDEQPPDSDPADRQPGDED